MSTCNVYIFLIFNFFFWSGGIFSDIFWHYFHFHLYKTPPQNSSECEARRKTEACFCSNTEGFWLFFCLLSRCWSQLYPSFVTVTLKAFRPSLIEEIIYPNWRLNMSASKLRAKRWHSCQMLAYHSRMLQCLSWPMNKCRGQKQCRIINKGITGLVTPPKFFRD